MDNFSNKLNLKYTKSGNIPLQPIRSVCNSLLLSSCLLLLGFSQLTFASKVVPELQLSLLQQDSMGMQTSLAKKSPWVPSNTYPAQANIPLKTIRILSSPLAGQITSLNYVHGPIQVGEVVAEIESPDLLKMQEEFLATLSDLKIAQQNLKRARQLNKSGVSSTKNLQKSQSKVKKLKLSKAQVRKSLALAGMPTSAIQKLEKTEKLQPAILQIKSPIDGQLFDLEVKLGQRISQNQSLISLGETNPIILVVHVPVKMANKLHEGQQVEVNSVGKTGVVSHIDPMVDPMTQSIDIHISVENNDAKLRTGQLINIRFLMTTKEAVYQTSANAIIQYNGQTTLFVKDKNSTGEESIRAVSINVVNISNRQLYFIPIQTGLTNTSPLDIYITGSTAIKSAFDAINASSEE